MTMKIKITNEDQSRTAVVHTVDGVGDAAKTTLSEHLDPGKETEVYIHSTRKVVVEEQQDG